MLKQEILVREEIMCINLSVFTGAEGQPDSLDSKRNKHKLHKIAILQPSLCPGSLTSLSVREIE